MVTTIDQIEIDLSFATLHTKYNSRHSPLAMSRLESMI